MERVSFLVEDTGERLACLLNPESVTLRRRAGLRRRRLGGRSVTAADLGEDALLFTGGGVTELRVDLLFDVAVSGSSLETDNVRDLTGPLWELAESAGRPGGDEPPRSRGRPRKVRFVWGKTWNVPAVVADVAERVELFSRTGVPRRSWLRMRLIRVPDADQDDQPPEAPRPPLRVGEAPPSGEGSEVRTHITRGGGPPDDGRGRTERLDNVAHENYSNAAFWRVIAAYNDIDDPLHLSGGQQLDVPPPSAVEQR